MNRRIVLVFFLFLSGMFTGCVEDGESDLGDDVAKDDSDNNPGGGSHGEPDNPPEEPQNPLVYQLGTQTLNQISAGGEHTCALKAEGKVWCWGNGSKGQLGHGTMSDLSRPDITLPAVDSNGDALSDIIQVSNGGEHTCALTSDGDVWCWGESDNGRLGDNCSSSCADKSHGVGVVNGTGIIQISAGESHTCALNEQSEVLCWGKGANGRLGNDSTDNKNNAVSVVEEGDSTNPLTSIIQVSAGGEHTCALTAEGGVKCWGHNGAGRLGNGSTAETDHPVDVITSNRDSTPLIGIVQVSAGSTHTCALTSAGEVMCWGSGSAGQLGNKADNDQEYPVDVVTSKNNSDPITGIVQISAGNNYTCALTEEGKVKCWGEALYGRLGHEGNSNSNYPVDVAEQVRSAFMLSGIAEIGVGENHACALTNRGEMRCWGRLDYSTTDEQPAPLAVHQDASGTHFYMGLWPRQYSCYSDDTCELDGEFLTRPHLTGTRSDGNATPEIKVLGVTGGENVALHTDANCSSASIGSGTVGTGAQEVTITPNSNLVAMENRIYAKVDGVCSLSGVDYTYQNGTERITGESQGDETTPTLTLSLVNSGDAVSIHKNPKCSDTALASGTASGNSIDVTLSELSVGTNTLYFKQNNICHPVGFDYKLASYIGKSFHVSAGGEHSCAVTSSGGVACWGEGGKGQLGNNRVWDRDHPVNVVDEDSNVLTGFVEVSAGHEHTCGLTSSGSVQCWGEGSEGRLGNKSTADTDTPVSVVTSSGNNNPLTGIVQISAGRYHTCALTAENRIKCWGYGANGQLGNRGYTRKNHPSNVAESQSSGTPLANIVQISTGYIHTCALTTEGRVKCWGDLSYRQLGTGCPSGHCPIGYNYPVDVVTALESTTPLSGIVQISAGDYHTCALTSGGTVKCWGGGWDGTLGEGGSTNNSKNFPVDVVNGSGSSTLLGNIVQITSGGGHNCALSSGGGAFCWGAGSNGELGNNRSTNRNYPVSLINGARNGNMSGVLQISSGDDHNCIMISSGEVRCWGYGNKGGLGNDAKSSTSYPVVVIDGDGSSTAINIGTTQNIYICGDLRCALDSE